MSRGKRKERQQESDCEVEANIDDPALRVVWEHVKHKIKATPRQSRTESFYQWVHDHSADVYALQEADAERALHQLEEEERRMTREASKSGCYRRKPKKSWRRCWRACRSRVLLRPRFGISP